MSSSRRGALRAAIAGAVVAALVTLPGLWVGTLWDNSETAYGEVAREILLTRDWVVMHLNGVPYFVQPPLYFWLGAAFSFLMGPTAFALRLPSALATIALGGFTGYAVARQAGTRVGIYAAVILSTCLMQAVIGRLAIMDALLDLAVAMSIFWWYRGIETGRDRYVVYGWIAAAGGFLAKGLVAPVVALLVIVPFYLWDRRHEATPALAPRAWLLGALAFVAIVAPWPLALVAHYHLFPLQKLVGEYTFGRYTSVVENQAGPLWYYLPVIILGFFPWIAFLPMAIVDGARSLGMPAPDERQRRRLLRLAFVWIVMPLLFFSFARTKLPNYLALEFPALALLTAIYFDGVVRKGAPRSAAISAATVPVTIGALAFAMWLFTRNNRLDHRDRQRGAGAHRHGPRDLRRVADHGAAGRPRAHRASRALRARDRGDRRRRRAGARRCCRTPRRSSRCRVWLRSSNASAGPATPSRFRTSPAATRCCSTRTRSCTCSPNPATAIPRTTASSRALSFAARRARGSSFRRRGRRPTRTTAGAGASSRSTARPRSCSTTDRAAASEPQGLCAVTCASVTAEALLFPSEPRI